MTKHEKEMHEKLVKSNVALEEEVENLKIMYNNGQSQFNKEQGKVEVLGDVIELLVKRLAKGYSYD